MIASHLELQPCMGGSRKRAQQSGKGAAASNDALIGPVTLLKIAFPPFLKFRNNLAPLASSLYGKEGRI